MFSIEVEFLAGRYTATSAFDYDDPEWPPHPGRLFSALYCAFAEGDFGDAEREALLWLESLRPPLISASNALQRETPQSYVPPNDFGDIEAVPKYRTTKAPRRFPTMIPDEPILHFCWKTGDSNEISSQREALQRLTKSIQYFGHSSTPVRVSVTDYYGDVTYEPHPAGTIPIRVPRPGRLQELEYRFSIDERPLPSAPVSYRKWQPTDESPVPESNFDEIIVFQAIDGPRFSLEGTYKLTSKVRNAVMSLATDPLRPIITGHLDDGSPLQDDHVAFVPLANVGNRWADGAILGFALLIPKSASQEDRRYIYRAIGGRPETEGGLRVLTFRDAPPLKVRRRPVPTRRSLQPKTYQGPSKRWATMTPMVFDRFPKEKDGSRKSDILVRACERIGLPAPASIFFHEHSRLVGTPPSSEYFVSPKASFSRRPRTHVAIEFEEKVRGPIVLGAGRYFGLGIMRPL